MQPYQIARFRFSYKPYKHNPLESLTLQEAKTELEECIEKFRQLSK